MRRDSSSDEHSPGRCDRSDRESHLSRRSKDIMSPKAIIPPKPLDDLGDWYSQNRQKYSQFKEVFHPVKNRGDTTNNETERIVRVIREKGLLFPLTRFFMAESTMRAAYNNLLKYVPEWIEKKHDELAGHSGKWWLPNSFKGKNLQLVGKHHDWFLVDIVVDWFTEYERVASKKEYSSSPEEMWYRDDKLTQIVLNCSKNRELDCRTLRDGVFYVARETSLFRVTRAKAFIQMILRGDVNKHDFNGFRWLDMSAGWGDRLLTACALKMDYLGFDPNENLRYGHSEMIQTFGNGRQRVIYKPFEIDESLQIVQDDAATNGKFDISLISPPFYIIERYNGQSQSVDTYPNLNDWLVFFLFKSLSVIWDNLKVGGYLAINIANIRNCDIVGPMLLYIEDFFKGCQWEGVITFSGRGTKEAPGSIYVFRKNSEDTPRKIWNPNVNRSLKSMFPTIYDLTLQLKHESLL